MSVDPYCVYVVVDGEYGERLSELAAKGPVWIVNTPGNREAVEAVWKAAVGASHLDGVTTFSAVTPVPEVALINVMSMVDLHHGAYSADPPYTELVVVGATATEKVRAELGVYGFAEFYEAGDGFKAVRELPVREGS